MKKLIISILTVTLFGLCSIQQASAATTSITGHITTINLDSKQVTVESSNQTMILGASKKQLKSLIHVDHDARYVAHKDLDKETRYFSDERNCLFFVTNKSYQ